MISWIYIYMFQTSLSVTLSNRQNLIPGSPAPMAMKEEASQNRKKTRGSRDMPASPTITLSQYWEDEDNDASDNDGVGGSWGPTIHDSVVEVSSAGGHNSRSSRSAAQVRIPQTGESCQKHWYTCSFTMKSLSNRPSVTNALKRLHEIRLVNTALFKITCNHKC